jgi:hypothetical protein
MCSCTVNKPGLSRILLGDDFLEIILDSTYIPALTISCAKSKLCVGIVIHTMYTLGFRNIFLNERMILQQIFNHKT